MIGIKKNASEDKIHYDVILEYQGYQLLFDSIVKFLNIEMIELEGNETLLVHIEVEDSKIVFIEFDVSMVIQPLFDKNSDLTISFYTFSLKFSNYDQVSPIIIPEAVK